MFLGHGALLRAALVAGLGHRLLARLLPGFKTLRQHLGVAGVFQRWQGLPAGQRIQGRGLGFSRCRFRRGGGFGCQFWGDLQSWRFRRRLCGRGGIDCGCGNCGLCGGHLQGRGL